MHLNGLVYALQAYHLRRLLPPGSALLLQHHGEIITAPVPLDLYEGTAPQITGIIARGENPYSFEHQPAAAYVYPPLYNILVAPLTGVFGSIREPGPDDSIIILMTYIFEIMPPGG